MESWMCQIWDTSDRIWAKTLQQLRYPLTIQTRLLGRVDICVIIVICQPSPYLIGNGQK